jgi:hypothetical protein
MKPKHHKSEHARTLVIESPEDQRFADRPAQAVMIAKLAAALERRKRKAAWVTDGVRADMLTRYANLLDDPNEAAQRNFMRWVVEDAHYLLAEGNFEMFCREYLMAEIDEVPALWDMAGEGPQ